MQMAGQLDKHVSWGGGLLSEAISWAQASVVQAPAEGGWPRGWEAARFSEVFLDAYPSPAQDLTALLCSVPRAVGRKQFMRFEWANHAAEALGCEYEELNTATFKHHLRQIIEQVTSGPSRRSLEDEAASSGTTRSLPGWTGSLRSHLVGTHQHPFTIRQGFIEGLLYVDLLGANKAASLEMVLAPSCTVLCPRVRGC